MEVRSPGQSHGPDEVCSRLERGGRESRATISTIASQQGRAELPLLRRATPPLLLRTATSRRRRPSTRPCRAIAADTDIAARVREIRSNERGGGLVPREEGRVFFPGEYEGIERESTRVESQEGLTKRIERKRRD
jgi:hypothetical protein